MTGIETAVLFTAASTVISTMGALQQAAAAGAAADFNEKVHNRNAKIARDQAAAEAEDRMRENRRKIGTIRNAYGASGLDMAGTPLDVLTDTMMEGDLDVRRELYKGEVRAAEQEDKAMLADMEGKASRRSMPFIAGAGLTRAGGTLLAG